MDIQEIADLINGNEYGSEMKDIDEIALKGHGIVVVFGYSDDNAEFRGAINEEVGCCNGGTFYITSEGLLENECDEEDCPYFEEIKDNIKTTIEALWDSEGFSWTYKTDIPHATFIILEDGDKYCKGIVFKLSELES